jgi:FG-GAP-like repeat
VTFTVTQAGTSSVPAGPLRWSSDFDGDGKNDILVQDSALGSVEAWFLDNSSVKGTQALSESLDTNWILAGRGDFNADGKPDLVWQHKTDGRLSLWYMDGTTRTSVVTPSNAPTWDPQWKVVGVGDFNADGQDDLAWQQAGTGALAAWLLNGSAVVGSPSLVPDRWADMNWKVVGVADFNNDGKSDLLWRNMGTGEVGAWLMNGLARIIYSPLSPFSVPDQGWQVGAVTDANGDGKPDIVWQHTNGTIMIWHMNGTGRVTFPTVTPSLPVGWRIVGPK